MRAGPLLLVCLSGLFAGTLAGCSGFADDPLGTLIQTGHDARVFNPRTGHYEWPDDPPHKHPQPAAPADGAGASATPAPSKPLTPGVGDDRVFNSKTQQFETPN